ncbi:hypothetical protein L198_05609 [Cryptococcus wingfieldii CBS 7118]|uniref:Uncharacterized protein n=1 Tax=Cryptococcus wingfieldii CBS 7118 TaxID=1295528 RepID=A0A1E3IW20_9TREE|nr:hypothetical protein L198_05609 [Cryptococcus wingfieldii CBS 7118]ODN92813.1 hypothetical protein L198_05609 [Cryptococcus wingfieldii CBS 7118]
MDHEAMESAVRAAEREEKLAFSEYPWSDSAEDLSKQQPDVEKMVPMMEDVDDVNERIQPYDAVRDDLELNWTLIISIISPSSKSYVLVVDLFIVG